jgi:hypothetical protein
VVTESGVDAEDVPPAFVAVIVMLWMVFGRRSVIVATVPDTVEVRTVLPFLKV